MIPTALQVLGLPTLNRQNIHKVIKYTERIDMGIWGTGLWHVR